MKHQLDNHPGILLHDITRLTRQVFGFRIRDLGLTESQWRVLGSVSKYSRISQNQLAILLGIGPAPLGKLVDRLEEEQLLERCPHPIDRRSKLLSVTRKGKPLTRTMKQRFQKLQKLVLQELNAKAIQDLECNLMRLYTKLSPQNPRDFLPEGEPLMLMHLITVISRLNSRRFDMQLRQLGFTRSLWLVLVAISKEEGTQQSQLARQLSMSKAPLGSLIDELESSGWVNRESHPQDRRAHSLQLSNRCKQQLKSLALEFEELHQHALEDVSTQQQIHLSNSLQAIRGQLKKLAGLQKSFSMEKST